MSHLIKILPAVRDEFSLVAVIMTGVPGSIVRRVSVLDEDIEIPFFSTASTLYLYAK